MAALSCYQPCRSHLAQPARCLDDDEQPNSFSFRRRQFVERCRDARERLPERPAEAQGSRRHAAAPVVRRDDIGWSKVEEVRKKFEGAAASAAYSRSFESPPRRRLADSLFASFKLPRRKESPMAARSLAPSAPHVPHAHVMTSQQHVTSQSHKRKSAVELLAESKAFYVKSEMVLDRKQELPLRMSSGLGQAIAMGGCHLISSGALNQDACCNPYATTSRLPGARRAVSAGEGLQNTLRRLLEHADSRENVYSPHYAVPHKIYSESRRHKDYPDRDLSRSQHNSGTFSGTSSSGTSGSKAKDPEKMNRPLSFGDARVFFPESFVIPRQRPEIVVKNAYSIPASSQSSPDRSEAPLLGLPLPDPPPLPVGGSADSSPQELAPPISPPPHYAHSAPRYVRSNSHSQPSMRDDDSCNINSHKSLPDLHAQARCYADQYSTQMSGTATVGRSMRRRRHSSHQRTGSCSSRGTRSNHSSLISCDAFSEQPSPGDENYPSYNSRCGSSFARDSGGSSGHYTQRSAPHHSQHSHPSQQSHHSQQQQHRTDSGSSTQHDHSSRYNYFPAGCYSPPLEQCVVSAPAPFQDGAPSPPAPANNPAPPYPPPPNLAPRVGIHFQASAPPPQFQDEPPVSYDYTDYECSYKPLKCLAVGRKDYSRDYGSRYHEPSTDVVSKQPQYAEPRVRQRVDDSQDYVNTAQTEEVTSPLGTFKRQRCLRYKQRRPRPILRSKSDISDRYRRSEGRSPSSAPCDNSPPESPSPEASRLTLFFERLGLEPRDYDAIVRDQPPESPVYFSSASTVDSNQLAATADYTVQGPAMQKPIYRNTEPPSVVERNARIIKWLCQCRKTQVPAPTG